MHRVLQLVGAHRYVLLLLVVFTSLTRVFPLRLQPIEPYLYAASAEGYYDLSTTFAASQPGGALPNFSRFHPNHPLLHVVVGFLHDITGIGALALFKAFNLAAALCSLLLVYAIALRLTQLLAVAALTATLLASTYAFWVGTLSGEVHLVAVALQLGSALFIVKYLQGAPKPRAMLRIATLLFALSVSVHLAAIFWGIAVFVAVVMHPMPKRAKLYLECSAIFAGVVLIVYGLLFVSLLKIKSFAEYKSTLMIYTYLQHVRYFGFEWFVVLMKSAGQSLFFGFSVWAVAFKVIIGLFVVAAGYTFWLSRATRAIKFLMLSWLPVYIFSHGVFGARADSIHSWLFSITGVVLLTALISDRIIRRPELRIYLVLLLGIVAANNLIFGILPNSLLDRSEYLYAEDPQVLLSGNGIELAGAKKLPLVVLAKDPVLTFPEIWHLGSHLNYKNQVHFIFCCGKMGYVEPLTQFTRITPEYFLLVDEISDEIPHMLEASGRHFRLLAERRGEVNPAVLVSSIYFERPAGYRIRKEMRMYYVNGPAMPVIGSTRGR